MKDAEKTIIIGAGPAGIAAGIRLGEQAIVLDARDSVGGLSGTIHFEGAVLDWGGHSFHTPHPHVRQLVFESLEMYQQPREARCFAFGKMIPYPFQANFQHLGDAKLTRQCQEGLAKAAGADNARNFEHYLVSAFGDGLANHFLLPYNRKLWGGDLTRLAVDWAGQRVAPPPGSRQTFRQCGGVRQPLQQRTNVAYPALGGFGEIMTALASRLVDLRCNRSVVRIDPNSRTVHLANGEVLRWSNLVSTVPLDRLVSMVNGIPESLLANTQGLEKLSLALVLVVVDHPIDTPIQRIYCADPDQPAHKIALNHNSSPSLRALPRHGIVGEVSYLGDDRPEDGELSTRFLDGLVRMNVIKSTSEVAATKVVQVPYAYPVPTHDRAAIVDGVKDWLRERNMYTVGRFGEWAYINSDEALHRGLELGADLACG